MEAKAHTISMCISGDGLELLHWTMRVKVRPSGVEGPQSLAELLDSVLTV